MKRTRNMGLLPDSYYELRCPACNGSGLVPADYPVAETVLLDRNCVRCAGLRTIVRSDPTTPLEVSAP